MVNGYIPQSLAEALEIRAANPVIPYAGGTELMVKDEPPENFLFLYRIPELRKIECSGDTIHIGPLCTFAELLENDAAPPLLKEAMAGIAAPAIRNMGTIGGNICNASPAGDTLPVLYLYDAVLVLSSLGSQGDIVNRKVPIADFILGVRKTVLTTREVLTGIEIPLLPFTRTAYQKVGARKAQAISKLSFAAAIRIDNGKIQDFRAAFGAVGATIVRRPELEQFVVQELQTPAGFSPQKILSLYEPFIRPITDQRSTGDYRKQVCLNLLGDFLKSFT